jgi:hypothetical protein
MEDNLVGEWRSIKPKAVSLKITKSPTADGDYYEWFSYTSDGQTYTSYWRIRNSDRGALLVLADASFWGGFQRRTGSGSMGESTDKIIELTADRFVVEWAYRGNPLDGVKDVYEFQKVTADVRAAEERARENAERERRTMLSQAPTLLVGSWRDENSLITYEADGTKVGKYDDGTTANGTWSIDGDILTSTVVERNGKRLQDAWQSQTQILELTQEQFVSKDVSGGKEWHAVRVK